MGWYAGNVFLGSHGATPLSSPLSSHRSVALCRAYNRASGLVHLIPRHSAHSDTRDRACTYTLYPSARKHQPSARGVGGGGGGGRGGSAAAGPPEMLRASAARSPAARTIERRREGVLRCGSTLEWVYVCVAGACTRAYRRGGKNGENERLFSSVLFFSPPPESRELAPPTISESPGNDTKPRVTEGTILASSLSLGICF